MYSVNGEYSDSLGNITVYEYSSVLNIEEGLFLRDTDNPILTAYIIKE
ncbi:MAG: hypothetical protein PUI48_00360 [Oscillospiraceae bacterium]|nr:hypothetical protein [Oscillospiraceae bacterium]MDY6207283.1 hypothetical protein [Oscillospiraceae bacterium]